MWGCVGLREGRCSNMWPRGRLAASLVRLTQSVLVSEVQAVLQPHARVLGFSQGCCSLVVASCPSWERGRKSETTYVVILVMSLSQNIS